MTSLTREGVKKQTFYSKADCKWLFPYYGSERSFLLMFSARDDLVKVSWKSDAWKCQNQLTPPYFDLLSERYQPLYHDRHDRRSCKIHASCVNFSRKQCVSCIICMEIGGTRFTDNKFEVALKLLKYCTLSPILTRNDLTQINDMIWSDMILKHEKSV